MASMPGTICTWNAVGFQITDIVDREACDKSKRSRHCRVRIQILAAVSKVAQKFAIWILQELCTREKPLGGLGSVISRHL